ncbi:MAG: OB-fold nucleic acid binding domain-containing protein, partial [Armatimonadota bacterium]
MPDSAPPKPRTGLDTEVQFLKGVGPKGAMLLQKLGLETVGDVLWYLPRRFDDRRNLPPIMLLRPGEAQTVRGRLVDISSRGTKGGKVLLKATVEDDSGQINLVWFNQPWVQRELQKVQGEIIAFGVVKEGMRRELEMSNPEWEAIDPDDDHDEFARLMPVYPLTEGVPQRTVRRAAASAVQYFAEQAPDPLPDAFRAKYKLKKLGWCLGQMHRPENTGTRDEARRRLVFEEFFYL